MIDAPSRAWAAGFFEGEGTIGLRQGGTSRSGVLQISIPQVDREVLDRFQGIFGHGIVYGPYSPPSRGPNQRAQHAYSCRISDQVLTILGAMWPWLGPVKRAQATRAITAWRLLPAGHHRGGPRCKKGHEDWYVGPDGKRKCRVCRRQRACEHGTDADVRTSYRGELKERRT